MTLPRWGRKVLLLAIIPLYIIKYTPNIHCNEPKPYKHDNVEQVRSSFTSCALLLRDTYDAFR